MINHDSALRICKAANMPIAADTTYRKAYLDQLRHKNIVVQDLLLGLDDEVVPELEHARLELLGVLVDQRVILALPVVCLLRLLNHRVGLHTCTFKSSILILSCSV